MENGVPQGSTILCNVYIKPLAKIILQHGTQHHLYVDDTQLYVDFPPTDHAEAVVGNGGLSSRCQRVALWRQRTHSQPDENAGHCHQIIHTQRATNTDWHILLSAISCANILCCSQRSMFLSMAAQVAVAATYVRGDYHLHRIWRIRYTPMIGMSRTCSCHFKNSLGERCSVWNISPGTLPP